MHKNRILDLKKAENHIPGATSRSESGGEQSHLQGKQDWAAFNLKPFLNFQ